MLLIALLAAQSVAVLPIEGALPPADAASLTAAAREVVKGAGYALAEDKASADAWIFGRAQTVEGATVLGLGLYKPGVNAPVAVQRVAGVGVQRLAEELRAQLPPLLAKGFGAAPAAAPAASKPGTLAMPKAAPPAASPAPPVVVAPIAPSKDPLVNLIREVTADVEQLRGLKRKENLKVEILDEELFTKAVREKAQKELTPAVVAAERARWLAFNLAPPQADPAQILLSVLDEQVAGFYDPFTKSLIVRKDPPASGDALGPDGLRFVLAHEIEHALQDQNFGIPDLSALPDDDTRLARVALFEGDAMAVMSAYAAVRAHKPWKVALQTAAALMRALDTPTLLKMSGRSPELAHAPPILREELVLPYTAGLGLVAEVVRRGGFALVDKMFAHPPLSGHQVLHPEAYFAGEAPTPLPFPAAPPGTKVVARGRMGELATRLALESCVDKAVVKDLAPAWAGDAYTIVEGPGRALSLLWISAWTDEAVTAANVMTMQAPCWADVQSPLGWKLGGAFKAQAAGGRVALARGAGDLEALLKLASAAKAETPKPAPPLGAVAAPPEAAPARVAGGKLQSPRLALEAEVPAGWAQSEATPPTEVAFGKQGQGGASLSFVPETLAGEQLDTFFQSAASAVAASQGAHLSFTGKAERKLLGGAAEERAWKMEGTPVTVRIEIAPFCGGRASLLLVRLETTDEAKTALDHFASTLAVTGPAPACAELE